MILNQLIENYAKFLKTVNKKNISDFKNFCHDDIEFIDPFHQFVGLEKFILFFNRTFDNYNYHNFIALDNATSSSAGYIKWQFSFKNKKGIKRTIDGMSEIKFSNNGLVISHIDYWDTGNQIYLKVPLLNIVIKYIKRKIKLV